MGGRSAINYQHYRKTLKGADGFSSNPKFNTAVLDATPKQIDYLKALLKQLEIAGADVSTLVNGELPTSMLSVHALIQKANLLKRDLGIKENVKVMFLNMCKERSTGKKIKYRTSHRYCAPVGYEFLYEISYDHIIPEQKVS